MTETKKVYVLSTWDDYEHEIISVTDSLEAAKLIEKMKGAEIDAFDIESFEDVKKKYDEWKKRLEHEEEWVLAELEKIKISQNAEYVSFYEANHDKILKPDLSDVFKSIED